MPCQPSGAVNFKFINSRSTQVETPLASLSEELRLRLTSGNYDIATKALYNTIVLRLQKASDIDPVVKSDAYYYAAVYNHNPLVNNTDTAILLYMESKSLRDAVLVRDEIYSKICGNLGLIYFNKGDPILSVQYTGEGLRVRQELYGIESDKTVSVLLNLTAANISASFFDQAIENALLGIKITRESGDAGAILNNIKFHMNAGNSYLGLRNYSIAEDYLNVAYNLYNQTGQGDTDLLLSILNALAVTTMSAGKTEQAIDYYKRAVLTIDERDYYDSKISITTYTNFAYLLGNHGDLEDASNYINDAVKMARRAFGDGSIGYQSELENYAYFIANYLGNIDLSLDIYGKFDEFIALNPWNKDFRNTVYYGFAQALQLRGSYLEALDRIEVVLSDSVYTSDRSRLISLLLKREVLYKLFTENGSLDYLKESFDAIRMAVDIYDLIRNDISTEESMLKAGSRYNYIYEECIFTLYQLYQATGDPYYSELSFSYSEKAKATSLLASTRQSRAMKFHIPEELSTMEMKLEKEIKTISELLYNEMSMRNPDSSKIARFEQIKLEAIMKNDSLRQVFEEEYPRYNALKSNTSVSGYRDVRKSMGRKRNFIEYFAADTILYIYLININTFEMHAVPYTKDLQQRIRDLREIIINPSIESGAKKQYADYTHLAYSIYKSLFSPLEKSLVSDRLVIAPDDLLSYLPFETLLTAEVNDSSLYYRRLPFLVNSYDIVYAYSGTLLAESARGGRSLRNPALTFAPDYSGNIYVDSLLVARQNSGGVLENIPGAREEAISVNRILGGELFLDNESTESRFKERAAGGRIIHLAMHTLLNDRDPMYSKMVFDLNDEGPNDGKLNTYEVYDVPLKAKMVVLSSCNTGSGYLQSGEGVMSLARGFFYSGSPTVVMSLWEVDDRSGSQIMKQFYVNLKRGSSKSNALRKARVNYLRNAEQMRSHPYFWCTLVIMGDDSPLFYSRARILVIIFGLIGLIGALLYRYRFKSS